MSCQFTLKMSLTPLILAIATATSFIQSILSEVDIIQDALGLDGKFWGATFLGSGNGNKLYKILKTVKL